jgi:hypothetical protein
MEFTADEPENFMKILKELDRRNKWKQKRLFLTKKL